MIDIGAPAGVDSAADVAIGQGRTLPDRFAVLPLRDAVTFPELMVPLNIGQERSIALINDVLRGDRSLVLVAGRSAEVETPTPEQLYEVGVLGTVARMVRLPDDTLRVLVQGGQRVHVDEWLQTEPYLAAQVSELADKVSAGPQLTALMRNVQRDFTAIAGQVPYLPEELSVMVSNVEDPVLLSHLVAGVAAAAGRAEAVAVGGARRRQAPAAAVGGAGLRAPGRRDRDRDPVPGPVRDAEGPARVLPAPAAEGDPGRARRGRRGGGRGQGAARAAGGAQPPGGGLKAGRS